LIANMQQCQVKELARIHAKSICQRDHMANAQCNQSPIPWTSICYLSPHLFLHKKTLFHTSYPILSLHPIFLLPPHKMTGYISLARLFSRFHPLTFTSSKYRDTIQEQHLHLPPCKPDLYRPCPRYRGSRYSWRRLENVR
jgi:hypothetical protein